MAGIAYLDSWAYMVYNADQKKLPNIDEQIPPVPVQEGGGCGSRAASDPQNQMWIQGAPPVYLNIEAPLPARSLDALACAVRACCDQANSRFLAVAKEADPTSAEKAHLDIPKDSILTPTTIAITAKEGELCSRNMVLSAFTLLQQYEATNGNVQTNQGHRLIVSALDAFLDGGDEENSGAFTDGQVQSLLNVCNTAIENPLVLYHAGPTYHMVSNAAILLCHLLNGMHAARASRPQPGNDMESVLFDQVLDTFLAVRKLLNLHRRKLPVVLRCHDVPRPNFGYVEEGAPFVDLGETLMCGCRGTLVRFDLCLGPFLMHRALFRLLFVSLIHFPLV